MNTMDACRVSSWARAPDCSTMAPARSSSVVKTTESRTCGASRPRYPLSTAAVASVGVT